MTPVEFAIETTRDWGVAMALSMARPLALTIVSGAFLYGQVNSGIVRAALAIALSLPVVAHAGPIFQTFEPLDKLDLVMIASKELLIGLIIGLMMSVPIFAMGLAGSIIDAYRLETPNFPDPSTEQTTTHGKLFAIIAVWTFAHAGGFWIMSDLLYSSYVVWPLHTLVVIPQVQAFDGMIELLNSVTKLALLIASPLLLLMFLNDLAFAIAARILRRFDSYSFAGISRNLILIFTIPAYIGLLSTLNITQTNELVDLRSIMEHYKEPPR